MKTVTVNGYVIKIGENARENTTLVRHAKKKHLWFHLTNFPSPHVVLECSDPNIVPDEVKRQCAALVRSYSARQQSPKLVHVDMLRMRWVKPTDVDGEVELLKGPQSVFKV